MSGLFVTIEGIDRSGKTTQAALLCEALGERALAVREPGGTVVGERVRELLKDPDVEIGARTEALLFAAARSELVAQVIAPALVANRIVVSDRFLDSSLAYQGGARKLGVARVAEINAWATDDFKPDLTILLELDAAAAAARGSEADRFELEGSALQESVGETYAELALADPDRWRLVDADRAPEIVHAELLGLVRAGLEE